MRYHAIANKPIKKKTKKSHLSRRAVIGDVLWERYGYQEPTHYLLLIQYRYNTYWHT